MECFVNMSQNVVKMCLFIYKTQYINTQRSRDEVVVVVVVVGGGGGGGGGGGAEARA